MRRPQSTTTSAWALLAVAVALTLGWPALAAAQSSTIYPSKISVGGTPGVPPTSSAALSGLRTDTSSVQQQALFIESNPNTWEVIRRAIVMGDLPANVADRIAPNTFTAANTFTALATFGGGVASGLSVKGWWEARDTVMLPLSAAGYDNVRGGINAGTPRLLLEDASAPFQIQLDNSGGVWRLARLTSAGTCEAVGCVPLSIGDVFEVGPKARAIAPVKAYETALGTQFRPFSEGWFLNIRTQNLIADDTIATTNGRNLTGYATILLEGISAAATTIRVRHNFMGVGDIGVLEADGKGEFIRIAAGPVRINRNANGNVESASTGYAATGGTLTRSSESAYRGGSALKYVATGTDVVYRSAAEIAGSTSYTCSMYVRRSDGAAFSTWSAGTIGFCASAVYAAPAQALDAGGGWWRLVWTDTSAASPSTTYQAILLPAGTFYVDALQIEAGTSLTEWNEHSSSYTVTRGFGGIPAVPWNAGNAIFNTGADAGYGWIDCYSKFGLRSTAELGPTCVGNVRTGTAFNAWAPFWALGNLNGLYGYTANTYGVGLGRYGVAGTVGANYTTIDPSNGQRFFLGGKVKAQFYANGILGLGGQEPGDPHIVIRPTNLQFCIFDGPCSITMDGVTGSLDLTGYLSAPPVTINAQGIQIDVTSVPTSLDTLRGYKFSPIAGGGAAGMFLYRAEVLTGLRSLSIENVPTALNSIGELKMTVGAVTGSGSTTRSIRFRPNTSLGCCDLTLPWTEAQRIMPPSSIFGESLLGDSGNRAWGQVWFREEFNLTTTSAYPLVSLSSDGGFSARFYAKTNGFNGTVSCPGGQAVKGFTADWGLVRTGTVVCGVP